MKKSAVKIKEIRERLNLKMPAFGKLIGVGKQAICNYESGRRHPNGEVVKKLVELAIENGVRISYEDFLQN